MSLLFPLNNYDESPRNRFLCLPKPADSFSLLDFHATGLTLRVGAAVTAIAAALPSKKVSHKKHKIENCLAHPLINYPAFIKIIFVPFVLFVTTPLLCLFVANLLICGRCQLKKARVGKKRLSSPR